MNIQDEVQKIHHQYGTSEKANYEIQKLVDKALEITYKKDGIELDGAFLSLAIIIEKCNDIKLKEDKLVLLEMGWDGRGGSIFERRALPLENVLKIKEILLDKEVYFGEIWGKHSEVYGNMREDTFEIVKDKKKIKDFLREYPQGFDFDHSFIHTFIENNEENEMQEDITQELLDKIKKLIR